MHKEPSHLPVRLYGQNLNEVDRYKYLVLPFGTKGLNSGRMCEVNIAKGAGQPAYFIRLDARWRFLGCSVVRVLTSFVQPSMSTVWY